MKKLMLTTAAAIAAVSAAFAGAQVNWFNGGVAADWPNDESMANGAWSAAGGGAAATLAAWNADETALELDTADDDLQFVSSEKTIGTGTDSVTCSSEMKFVAFSSVPETVDPTAKAGVIVVKEGEGAYAYYVLAKDGDNAANVWTKLEGEATADAYVNVTVTTAPIADSADTLKVTYQIGTLAASDVTVFVADKKVEKAVYNGSGFVKSLAATAVTETKAFAIDATALAAKNLEVTDVANATFDSESGKYVVAYGDVVTVTFDSLDGYVKNAQTKEIAYADLADIAALPEGVTEPVEGVAQIVGGDWYASLEDAYNAAGKGATIRLGRKAATGAETIEGPGFRVAEGKFGAGEGEGLTIDFGGNTYAFTSAGKSGNAYADDPRAFYILRGNKITLKNGTLKGADVWVNKVQDGETNYPMGEFIRNFCEGVTLDNMVLDGTNLKVNAARGVRSLNGDINIVNGTKILKPTGEGVTGFLAIVQGDYSGNYATGKTTIDTTGEIEGNFGFYGGSAELKAAKLDATAEYIFGRVKNGAFAPANFTGFGFKAAVGEILDEEVTDTEFHADGKLYKSAAAALAAIGDATAVTLLANATEAVSVPAGKTLKAGAYAFESTITLAVTARVMSDSQIAKATFTEVTDYEIKETPLLPSGYVYELAEIKKGLVFTIAFDANVGSISYVVAGTTGDAIAIDLTQGSPAKVELDNPEGAIVVSAKPVAGYRLNKVEFALGATATACAYETSAVDPAATPADGDTPAQYGIENAAFAGDTGAALAKPIKWAFGAGAKGSLALLNAANFEELNAAAEAYLLNCAPAELEQAKAAFKFDLAPDGTSIPEVSTLFTPNGTVTIKGATTLGDWHAATADDAFFKAELAK